LKAQNTKKATFSMQLIYLPAAFTLTIYLLIGCNHNSSLSSASWQLIAGRDDGQIFERPLLYRALVPTGWIRQDPPLHESIANTTKSICEFYIHEKDQSIRLTIHTFPIMQTQLRIPPQAQIARWKREFEELDLVLTHTQPESHGGFNGLFFEGQGILQGKPRKVMGWSMQLASVYERQLNQAKDPLERRKCADYTIKASGAPDLMDKHRIAIMAFAHSFELIDELPLPL
jgi:hypothetical protein